MKSWLPTTLLLLYFAYYVFAIQEIELDPWSLGELMTARTLPSIVGVIALAVLIIQIVKPCWNNRNRDQRLMTHRQGCSI